MSTQLSITSKLKGQELVGGQFSETEVETFLSASLGTSTGVKVIFIPTLQDEAAFRRLALDQQCQKILTSKYQFPNYLFTQTWRDCNGFADIKQISQPGISADVYIIWFRILVKMLRDPKAITADIKDYYWLEMTFLIHQLGSNSPTVICCDCHSSFQDEFLKSLDSYAASTINTPTSATTPASSTPGWNWLTANLLQQACITIDSAIWECSKMVRAIEKNRVYTISSSPSTFDFYQAHDLLRHALHNTETLTAASSNLASFLSQYKALVTPPSTSTPSARTPHDDHLASIAASIQLLRSLTLRNTSNEARLRNEIGLAFNVVSQKDAKAVRTISIVTLSLLPATFVSTLFSMSFFKQPDSGYIGIWQPGWGVSGWIWVYFVIAVPLTAGTVAAWVWAHERDTWLKSWKTM